MTIYSEDKDGNIIISFDSRWQFPEVFGYKPEDPQYKLLRRLWEEATGKTISEEETAVEDAEALLPKD